MAKSPTRYWASDSPSTADLDDDRFQRALLEMTLVNGQIAWQNGQVTDKVLGKRLTFNR